MPPIITCAAALNPCFNVSGVDYLIENISRDLEFADDGFATRSVDYFHESFQGLYNMYYTKYGSHQTQSTTAEGSSSQKSRDPLSRMVHGLTQHKQKKARGDPIMSSEYEQYIKTDFVRGLQPKDYESYDVLGFWKTKENQFPVLSRMALDILSVQASSVASESAFSTSGRILSIRRTRLTAESLEMCMCLKDHLDAHERRQHTTPLELPLDVEEGVFNDEVQMNEATQLTDQEIALDASSDGSFEEPPRDYMLSSGAEDDETQDGAGGLYGLLKRAKFISLALIKLCGASSLYALYFAVLQEGGIEQNPLICFASVRGLVLSNIEMLGVGSLEGSGLFSVQIFARPQLMISSP
ncbi:zinc finger BED domain-containing protein RICESLEEPER 2 [Tanacetum coccineum]|uniref:Zinc finger BED domain-containing protein RICESLEEPER 2 n=1 Tax=Tanacetum coccineum TaxID=301880 RepID=A0ABQ4XUN3_9ASTR